MSIYTHPRLDWLDLEKIVKNHKIRYKNFAFSDLAYASFKHLSPISMSPIFTKHYFLIFSHILLLEVTMSINTCVNMSVSSLDFLVEI